MHICDDETLNHLGRVVSTSAGSLMHRSRLCTKLCLVRNTLGRDGVNWDPQLLKGRGSRGFVVLFCSKIDTRYVMYFFEHLAVFLAVLTLPCLTRRPQQFLLHRLILGCKCTLLRKI